MGTDVARGVVNQTQTTLGGPVLPEDFQLRNSRDPEGQHSSQRLSQLLVLDHLPNLEDTRIVSSSRRIVNSGSITWSSIKYFLAHILVQNSDYRVDNNCFGTPLNIF